MVFTTIGFYKADTNAALAAIQPIADQHVTTSGDDLTVPELNQILAYLVTGTTITEAQLQSPSLRKIFLEDTSKAALGATFVGFPEILEDLSKDPIPLDVAEKLNLHTVHGTAAYALVWLGDGPIAPVHGPIRTLKTTIDTAGSAGVWTNSALTLNQTLPAGRYQIVGMRAFGTALLAVRLVLVGSAWRPGVPASDVITGLDYPMFRRGRFGSFGEFEFDQPPKVDILGSGATSAQFLFLDLIQVREGRS